MNLKQNRITVGELLDNPASKAVFQRRFPTVMKHPMLRMARSMTLEQLIVFAKGHVTQEVIKDTLQELQRL